MVGRVTGWDGIQWCIDGISCNMEFGTNRARDKRGLCECCAMGAVVAESCRQIAVVDAVLGVGVGVHDRGPSVKWALLGLESFRSSVAAAGTHVVNAIRVGAPVAPVGSLLAKSWGVAYDPMFARRGA